MLSKKRLDLLGAYVALAIYLSAILVFLARLSGGTRLEYWLGVFELCLALPLLLLVGTSRVFHRSTLYVLQVSLMLAWLLMEYILDFRLQSDFRSDLPIVILYVMLFFAGTGGMIGVASLAGRSFGRISIVLFLLMAVLAFLQRYVTGQ
ncbi:hypothetical protein [Exiguobacterium flavidum]|uniref:hypothetical protein n=1 Tax=Exiguobacterium flavidum TaxID=2184695 RepID=UPI000DF786DC|nr:hypothetical protein [Exiguobacterium flavidum]